MGARGALISEWRNRLEQDSSQAETAPPRYGWLFRARARIYRVLLAMYGRGDWRSDRDQQGEEVVPSATNAVAELPPLEIPGDLRNSGKPAKSPGEIRKTLKLVTQANDARPAGNYARNSTAFLVQAGQHAIVLTSTSPAEHRRAKWAFLREGISSLRKENHLLVLEQDREPALAILAEMRAERRRLRFQHLRETNRMAWSVMASFGILLLIVIGVASAAYAYMAIQVGVTRECQIVISAGILLVMHFSFCWLYAGMLHRRRD